MRGVGVDRYTGALLLAPVKWLNSGQVISVFRSCFGPSPPPPYSFPPPPPPPLLASFRASKQPLSLFNEFNSSRQERDELGVAGGEVGVGGGEVEGVWLKRKHCS